MSMKMTSTVREAMAEKSGPRKTIYGVKRNERYLEEMRDFSESERQPYKTGEQYRGEWQGDKRNGFGSMTWASGNMYEGEWMGGLRHGKGTLWVKRGGRLQKQYAGDWEDGKRSGVGVSHYTDGSKYEGQWREGKRQGRGTLTAIDGTVYEGEWNDNVRSGLGVMRKPNGDVYRGHWLKDLKEGPGEYFFKSTNKIYVGEWCSGSPKCGEYREAMGEDEGTSLFQLPPLGLLNADKVLSEAIAWTRNDRAETLGSLGEVFTTDEMHALRAAFEEQARGNEEVAASGIKDLLEGSALRTVIGEGGGSPPSAVDILLKELGVDGNTGLTFSDFVDLVAILGRSPQAIQ
jgi:hypothetical protein